MNTDILVSSIPLWNLPEVRASFFEHHLPSNWFAKRKPKIDIDFFEPTDFPLGPEIIADATKTMRTIVTVSGRNRNTCTSFLLNLRRRDHGPEEIRFIRFWEFPEAMVRQGIGQFTERRLGSLYGATFTSAFERSQHRLFTAQIDRLRDMQPIPNTHQLDLFANKIRKVLNNEII